MTESFLRRVRRTYSAEFKSRLIAEAPGVSVADIARRHGLNHNLIFKWRRESADRPFLPVRILAAVPAPDAPGSSASQSPPSARTPLRITLVQGHHLECDASDRVLLDHLLTRLLGT